MALPKLKFEIDTEVNGCVIYRIDEHRNITETGYAVRNLCCGRKAYYMRRALSARLRADHLIMCQSCANKRVQDGIRVNPPKNIDQVYVDGWGWSLTKMGHRYGDVHAQPQDGG